MRRVRANLCRLSSWLICLTVLGSCGSETVSSLSPNESTTLAVTDASLATSSTGDRASLIFQGEDAATLEDSALTLVLFNLPLSARDNQNALINGANSLLQGDPDPAIEGDLSPRPNNDNANFVRPPGVQLVDVAAIYVASQAAGLDRPTLAATINNLLGTNVSGTGENSDIISIPGGGAGTPSPDPSGSPTPSPTANPDDVERLSNGENCSPCNVFAADLSGLDLTDLNVSNSDLRRTDLSEATLVRTDFSNSQMGNVILSDANLQEATLTGSFLPLAQLQRAALVDAVLNGADIGGAQLNQADLTRVNAPDVVAINTNFRGATLNDSIFIGARLNEADFTNANMGGADFTDAKFINADLRDANNLAGATLTGAEYNSNTRFPNGFDPDAAGMVLIE